MKSTRYWRHVKYNYQAWKDQGRIVTLFKGSRFKFERREYTCPTNEI